MINKNKVYTYIAASLAIIMGVPGRIAWGVLMLIHFNVLIALTTLLTHALRRLEIESMRAGLIAVEIIALTVLYKQILSIICPIAALTLGFSLYLPAASSVIMTILVSSSFNDLKTDMAEKMKDALVITGFCISLFVIRDIFGFSTITLPSWQNIIVIKIPVLFSSLPFASFIATIPGGLIITALVLLLITKLSSRGEENV